MGIVGALSKYTDATNLSQMDCECEAKIRALRAESLYQRWMAVLFLNCVVAYFVKQNLPGDWLSASFFVASLALVAWSLLAAIYTGWKLHRLTKKG